MKYAIYGFPCVSDPHDFIPDEESCTPAEIAAHKLACETYGTKAYQSPVGCGFVRSEDGTRFAHVLRTSWGIGTNMVEMDEEAGTEQGGGS